MRHWRDARFLVATGCCRRGTLHDASNTECTRCRFAQSLAPHFGMYLGALGICRRSVDWDLPVFVTLPWSAGLCACLVLRGVGHTRSTLGKNRGRLTSTDLRQVCEPGVRLAVRQMARSVHAFQGFAGLPASLDLRWLCRSRAALNSFTSFARSAALISGSWRLGTSSTGRYSPRLCGGG